MLISVSQGLSILFIYFPCVTLPLNFLVLFVFYIHSFFLSFVIYIDMYTYIVNMCVYLKNLLNRKILCVCIVCKSVKSFNWALIHSKICSMSFCCMSGSFILRSLGRLKTCDTGKWKTICKTPCRCGPFLQE